VTASSAFSSQLTHIALTSAAEDWLMQCFRIDGTVTIVLVGKHFAAMAMPDGEVDAAAVAVVADAAIGDQQVADCSIALKPLRQVYQAVAIEHPESNGSAKLIAFAVLVVRREGG